MNETYYSEIKKEVVTERHFLSASSQCSAVHAVTVFLSYPAYSSYHCDLPWSPLMGIVLEDGSFPSTSKSFTEWKVKKEGKEEKYGDRLKPRKPLTALNVLNAYENILYNDNFLEVAINAW